MCCKFKKREINSIKVLFTNKTILKIDRMIRIFFFVLKKIFLYKFMNKLIRKISLKVYLKKWCLRV